ncbi:MAG TPA: hypothetical protein VHS31_16110 [Tepidisphaeraceae bacterium]|nr:hypothetical protein [Tepidisphaeraceae bacterium]
MLIISPPLRFRKRRARSKATNATPPAPINMISSVTMQSDGVTLDIFFTPGTVVTGFDNFDDNFYVNYPDGQTSGNFPNVVSPNHVRVVLSDQIAAPSTWEVDDPVVSTFQTGSFAGPNSGDVVFV